nr:MAG TPA_asm: hypothetical protein [Caudoviricetes sp.]
MYSFSPQYEFSKGVAYFEAFDVATDDLVGFSKYVTEFSPAGSMNDGAVEGGPGNMLIMNIPDTTRLSFTAKTADSALNNMALTIGQPLTGNGVVETSRPVIASDTTLKLTGAVAPLGGQNGPIAYVMASTGNDKDSIAANSGKAYKVGTDGTIQGFTAVAGNTYCVKYFVQNSSALQLSVPALFQPKIVRVHYAVNIYAKKVGGDAKSSSLWKIRHYYIPYYFFTGALSDTINQTTPGSVDLSGNCLTADEVGTDVCASNAMPNYCYIVDEFVSGTSTGAIEGIYFIGAGAGVSVASGSNVTLVAKYDVAGSLTNISDMSEVTFATTEEATAKFADPHSPVLTGVAAGTTTATVTVTNSETKVTYTDTIPVTVT